MPEFWDSLQFLLKPEERAVLREIHEVYRYTFVSAAFFRNTAPWRLEWRTCPDHFFLFPVVGRLHVVLREEEYTLKAGEFLMLPENVWHHLRIAEKSPRLHQISLHAHIHDRWGHPFLERCRATRGRLMHTTHDLEALQRLAHLQYHQEEVAQSVAESFLKQLLAFQLQAGIGFEPRKEKPKGDLRVTEAIRRMEKDFGSNMLDVEMLAREAGVTATHFRKLFRRDTGQRPGEYLARLRLRQAQLRLRQTTWSIKEVAAACGFGSDHYFHLVFRRAFGCTPSEYRRYSFLAV